MASHSFKDLKAWQQAMELAVSAYKVTKQLPDIEQFALADQIRRSATSIPSNLAEGQKRNNRAEYIQFCGIALGSAGELETQLILVKKLYGVNVSIAQEKCQTVAKLNTGLIKSLRLRSTSTNYQPRTTN